MTFLFVFNVFLFILRFVLLFPVKREKSIPHENLQEWYILQHSWLLFSSVALTSMDCLLSSGQDADENYIKAAGQLYCSSVDILIQQLMSKSKTLGLWTDTVLYC